MMKKILYFIPFFLYGAFVLLVTLVLQGSMDSLYAGLHLGVMLLAGVLLARGSLFGGLLGLVLGAGDYLYALREHGQIFDERYFAVALIIFYGACFIQLAFAKRKGKTGAKKGKRNLFLLTVSVFCVLLVGFGTAWQQIRYWNLIPEKKYVGDHFQIRRVTSSVDFNQNGRDDYEDFLIGARKDARNRPKYDGKYIEGGFPPPEIGVCTDVVWRAFREAGYDLREMVDRDIARAPEAYPRVEKRDKNIDFRRVKNLRVFFDRHGVELTTDIRDIEAWQPGDIVFFKEDTHIGIVSDLRNKKGEVYIIHNGGQPRREEDYFKRFMPEAHYRFDASLLSAEVLVPWEE